MIYKFYPVSEMYPSDHVCPVLTKHFKIAVSTVGGTIATLPCPLKYHQGIIKFEQAAYHFEGKNRFAFASQLTKKMLELGIFCTTVITGNYQIGVFTSTVPNCYAGKNHLKLPF